MGEYKIVDVFIYPCPSKLNPETNLAIILTDTGTIMQLTPWTEPVILMAESGCTLGLGTETAWNNEKFSFSQLFLWRIFTWYSMQKLVNYVIFVILCSFCSKLLRSNICFHFLPSEVLVYNILLMEPIVPVTVKQSRMITHKLATKQNITKKHI